MALSFRTSLDIKFKMPKHLVPYLEIRNTWLSFGFSIAIFFILTIEQQRKYERKNSIVMYFPLLLFLNKTSSCTPLPFPSLYQLDYRPFTRIPLRQELRLKKLKKELFFSYISCAPQMVCIFTINSQGWSSIRPILPISTLGTE
jgi:hypothetical protein